MENADTILLAEDNQDDVVLIERAFRALGTTRRLVVVPDGEDAVSYLKGIGRYADRTRWPFPCLILLDLYMPRLNGLQVLVWLRQQPEMRQVPVIMLTTSAFSSDVRAAYLLGANSFLTKPREFSNLVSSVRRTCDYWLEPSHATPSTGVA